MNKLPLNDLLKKFPPVIRDAIEKTIALVAKTAQPTVLVGGVVRDLIMTRPVYDADLMVEDPASRLADALSQQLQAQPTFHEKFKTYVLKLTDGSHIDIVTARTESYPEPGSLPAIRPSTIADDLKRRDFTVNAMALWLNQDRVGEILDPLEGELDVSRRLIRILHDRSFIDDPTRIFRAARFAGRFSFEIEVGTFDLLRSAIQDKRIENLSPVRRRHELEMILKEDEPGAALALVADWGVIRAVHPELTADRDMIKRVSAEVPREGRVVQRLSKWMKGWDRQKMERVLTDLSFEKTVKREILG